MLMCSIAISLLTLPSCRSLPTPQPPPPHQYPKQHLIVKDRAGVGVIRLGERRAGDHVGDQWLTEDS